MPRCDGRGGVRRFGFGVVTHAAPGPGTSRRRQRVPARAAGYALRAPAASGSRRLGITPRCPVKTTRVSAGPSVPPQARPFASCRLSFTGPGYGRARIATPFTGGRPWEARQATPGALLSGAAVWTGRPLAPLATRAALKLPASTGAGSCMARKITEAFAAVDWERA